MAGLRPRMRPPRGGGHSMLRGRGMGIRPPGPAMRGSPLDMEYTGGYFDTYESYDGVGGPRGHMMDPYFEGMDDPYLEDPDEAYYGGTGDGYGAGVFGQDEMMRPRGYGRSRIPPGGLLHEEISRMKRAMAEQQKAQLHFQEGYYPGAWPEDDFSADFIAKRPKMASPQTLGRGRGMPTRRPFPRFAKPTLDKPTFAFGGDVPASEPFKFGGADTGRGRGSTAKGRGMDGIAGRGRGMGVNTGAAPHGRGRGASGIVGVTCFKCGELGHAANRCTKGPGQGNTSGFVGITCFKCGELGHAANKCPNGPGQDNTSGFNGITCFKCGELGHAGHRCTNGQWQGGNKTRTEKGYIDSGAGSGGTGVLCFKCGQRGHSSPQCQKFAARVKAKSQNTCFRCGDSDHQAKDCPNKGTLGGTSGPCFKCLKDGHVSKDCPDTASMGNTCYNCGREGHFSYECPTNPTFVKIQKVGSGAGSYPTIRGQVIRHCIDIGAPMNPNEMTLSEKIQHLSIWLQQGGMMFQNPIQTIENALIASRINLRPEYRAEELMRCQTKLLYTGYMKLGGVFLSRSVERNKKDLKCSVFEIAVDTLKNKPLHKIMQFIDPGPEPIKAAVVAKQEEAITDSLDLVGIIDEVTAKANGGEASLHQELMKLVKMLKEPGKPVKGTGTSVSILENAFRVSQFDCSNRYMVICHKMQDQEQFTGAIIVSSTILGEGTGKNRKDCKLNTYLNALVRLKNEPIDTIMNGKHSEEFERESSRTNLRLIKSSIQGTAHHKSKMFEYLPLHEKLEQLIWKVRGAGTLSKTVTNLDGLVFQIDLSPTCVYRKLVVSAETTIVYCDLYVSNVFVASSSPSDSRRDAQISVYGIAWNVLATATGMGLMSRNRFLTDEVRKQPNVIECITKGHGKLDQNNRSQLDKSNIDPFNPDKPVSTLVLFEHGELSQDRTQYAFGILCRSATICGMLAEWDVTVRDERFWCVIQIQKHFIAEWWGLSKAAARNNAAYRALSVLAHADHHFVKQNMRLEEENAWIPWPEIHSRSNDLRRAAGDIPLPISFFEGERDAKMPADKWIVEAVIERFNAAFTTDILEDILIGPGLPDREWFEILRVAETMDVRADTRKMAGKVHYAMSKKYNGAKVVALLQEKGGTYGRYKLLSKFEAEQAWSMHTPQAKKIFDIY